MRYRIGPLHLHLRHETGHARHRWAIVCTYSMEGVVMSRVLSITALVVSGVALAACAWTSWELHQSQSPQRVLSARGLVISDGNGQARIILGAPAPDPTSEGRSQGPRATPVTGMVLVGPDGSERGSFATTDSGGEAVLTLDDARGVTEVFKVVANPDRGATLTIKHQNNTGAMLSSWQGEPELLFVDGAGRALPLHPGTAAAP